MKLQICYNEGKKENDNMAIPINVIDDVRKITTNSMLKEVDEIEDLNNKIKIIALNIYVKYLLY